MGWGGGSIPIHHHTTAVVGVPLPPWPEHSSISGAALDDAEHSLADLDFRDQLARRLFCVDEALSRYKITIHVSWTRHDDTSRYNQDT